MYTLTKQALKAFNKGVQEGTITDSIEDVIGTLIDQDVVTYCSENGCYTFDYLDIEIEESL